MSVNYRKIFCSIIAVCCLLGGTVWYLTSKHNATPTVTKASPSVPARAARVILPTAEEIKATANARPCDQTVITNLDLSRPPSESDLIAAGNLGKKLTPTRSADASLLLDPAARKLQELDNLSFGTAIQAWNEHRYPEAVRLFTEHLQSFPNSPWAGEALLHTGCQLQYVGRFTESAEMFDKAMAVSPPDSEMHHKAQLRRAIINIDLGGLDEASKSLAESLATNKDPEDQSYASYWVMQLSILKANETALRDCGQKALAQVARLQGDSETATTLTNLPAAGPHGFTAAELHSLALANGFSSFPVEAPLALDVLPLPFIAHYNDRHYVTVEAVSKDTVKLYDSRISTTTEMPRGSFERAWSGFALLVKEPPHNESIHVAQNLDQIVGGCCGLDRLVSNLGKDHCDKSCNAPANSVDDSRGLPSYSVNPINMNFKVIDTPMWWDAPVGPAVSMTLLFNSQDSQNNYTPFGGKWAFEYASYLLITPSNNSQGGGCQVRDGDGRMESFTLPATGSSYPKTYGPPPGDFRTLVETALYQFDLTQQDGTVYHYGIPAAAAGNSNVPLLLSITDRHNNTIAITHNANGAITKIEHSALPGKSWDLTYSTIGSVSRCTAILDPFSRSAHFAYDTAGHLTSQIDMGGLAYSYTYTSTGPLFITSITTPSGTSTVYTEPADGIYNSTNHYPDPSGVMWQNYRITINDHLGFPTEYYYSGFYRRGYMRNPIQMQRTPGNLDPENGSRTQFGFELVGGKGQITSTDLLDENGHGVFQSQNTGYDNTTRLASYLSDGNGGQNYLEYNLKGKPTLIDPHGNSGDEEILITYQANGIDVDTITRTLQGVSKTLVDYSYFSNRDIQSVTDVNGRTISYLWYSNGLLQQITDSVTGDVVVFTYDTHLRPSTTSINSVVVSTTVYDTDGKGVLQASLAPNGQYASYEYDDLNRLTRELHSDDSFTAYQWACCYIEATRYGKIVGGSEKTLKRSVTHHDARVLPLSTTNTDGLTTRYSYDIAGRLTGLTDSKGQTTQWQLNGPGQLMKKIYPDASEENYTYDNSGHLESYVNRRSQVTWINYDNDGQPHDIQAYDNLSYSITTFTYDSWRRLGNLAFQAYQSGNWVAETHTFTHDLIGRVTSIDGPWADDTIGYAYNDAARTVTRTSPGGMTQTSTADAYGRIDSIANVLGTFTNTYDSVGGPLTQITHTGANAGFDTAFTYLGDDFNRALATITSYKPGAAAVSKHTYTYDPLGNIATWNGTSRLKRRLNYL